MTNVNECLGIENKGYVIVVNVWNDCCTSYVEIILLKFQGLNFKERKQNTML